MEIYINGHKITKMTSTYKIDKIRNLNIGYIFQDYKLIENYSVFDNVAIALKMIGIKDKKEIAKREKYISIREEKVNKTKDNFIIRMIKMHIDENTILEITKIDKNELDRIKAENKLAVEN